MTITFAYSNIVPHVRDDGDMKDKVTAIGFLMTGTDSETGNSSSLPFFFELEQGFENYTADKPFVPFDEWTKDQMYALLDNITTVLKARTQIANNLAKIATASTPKPIIADTPTAQ